MFVAQAAGVTAHLVARISMLGLPDNLSLEGTRQLLCSATCQRCRPSIPVPAQANNLICCESWSSFCLIGRMRMKPASKREGRRKSVYEECVCVCVLVKNMLS